MAIFEKDWTVKLILSSAPLLLPSGSRKLIFSSAVEEVPLFAVVQWQSTFSSSGAAARLVCVFCKWQSDHNQAVYQEQTWKSKPQTQDVCSEFNMFHSHNPRAVGCIVPKLNRHRETSFAQKHTKMSVQLRRKVKVSSPAFLPLMFLFVP